MKDKVNKSNALTLLFSIYFICFFLRIIEYFFIDTDRTLLGEAVIHKLLGIAILFMVVKKYNIKDIGFRANNKISNLLIGLGIGIFSFLVAYFVEIFVFIQKNNFLGVEFYVTSYSPTGNYGKNTALIFFVICVIGNIINVMMEEGIFRGLFQKLLENKYSFLLSAVIASTLFGIWHIVSPLRLFYEGQISPTGLLFNSLFLVITSTLVGFNFALMTKLSQGLYVAIACHFVNNTIVNIVHLISNTGADQFMAARIGIAQSLSFVIVLIWYFAKQRKQAENSC